jgi:SM-20-related protein
VRAGFTHALLPDLPIPDHGAAGAEHLAVPTGTSPDGFAALLPGLVDALVTQGWHLARRAVSHELTDRLTRDLDMADRKGALRAAAIGRGSGRRHDAATRSDRICWLPETPETPAQAEYLAFIETLRHRLNRELYLGLNGFEGHYATYGPGARYARHLDRFRDDDARVVSCILYLNPDWQEDDGGQLRLETGAGTHVEVLPEAGTLVTFLSDRFWHEVLPARRTRRSVTGWLLRRP